MNRKKRYKRARNSLLRKRAVANKRGMPNKYIKFLKFHVLRLPKKKPSNLENPPELSTDSKFIKKKNDSDTCWLDASMDLLVHNKSIRQQTKLNPDCLVSKMNKIYDEAISIFNDFSSDKTTHDRLYLARDILQTAQDLCLKYLHPLIQFKRDEPNSPCFSLRNLIKEDKLIRDIFNVAYAWCRQCDNCEMQRVFAATKTIITIANVNKFVPEDHISPSICPVCKTKDQTIKLVYKKLPACLIFHFENGAGELDSPPLNFHVASREYQLTGLMTMEKDECMNKHYTNFIRDPYLKKWLYRDTSNVLIESFNAVPHFVTKDVYIYVYEAFDGLGTIQIEDDPSLSSQNHDIECINICDEENDDVISKIPEKNERSESTETVKSTENITAVQTASFKADSSTRPTSTAKADKLYLQNIDPPKIATESSLLTKKIAILPEQKADSSAKTTSNAKADELYQRIIDPPKIATESSLLTKEIAILPEQNIASEKVNANNSDQTNVSEFANNLKNDKLLGLSSENRLNKKLETPLCKEDKIIPKPVVTLLSLLPEKYEDIENYINFKTYQYYLQCEPHKLNKYLVTSVSSNCSYTNDRETWSIDSSFIMWKNNSNVCWLNASMALLVHNQLIRHVINFNPDCIVSKVAKCYDDAITNLNEFSSDKTTEDKINLAREILQPAQDLCLKYLQPRMKYIEGNPESAFCALLNLIQEDEHIKGVCDVTYAWCGLCDMCEKQRVVILTKPIITIANGDKFLPENHISLCLCPTCKNPQRMNLVYKKLPACLIFHFENGAGKEDSPCLNFHIASREYQLTGVMLLKNMKNCNSEHFKSFIRDPLSTKWLDRNDLKNNIATFVPEQPNFDLKDVYIYVYETVDNLGTISIKGDPSLSSSNHNIPCIDISGEEVEQDDVNNNQRPEATEPVESIGNITAFMSDSSTQSTSFAETDKHQKYIDPSKIIPESSLITKNVSTLVKQNKASLKVNVNNSDQTTISKLGNNLKNGQIFELSSENSLFNMSNGLNEKQNPSLCKEDKIFEISKHVETPPNHDPDRYPDMDDYNEFLQSGFQLPEELYSVPKKSFTYFPSKCSHTNNTASTFNIISPITKEKEMSKVDGKEKAMRQYFEISHAEDSHTKNKVCKGINVVEAPDFVSNTSNIMFKIHETPIQKKNEFDNKDMLDKEIELKHETVSGEEIPCKAIKYIFSNKLSNKNLKMSSTGVATAQQHNSLYVEFSKANEAPDASVHGDTKNQSSNKKRHKGKRKNVFYEDNFSAESNSPSKRMKYRSLMNQKEIFPSLPSPENFESDIVSNSVEAADIPSQDANFQCIDTDMETLLNFSVDDFVANIFD